MEQINVPLWTHMGIKDEESLEKLLEGAIPLL